VFEYHGWIAVHPGAGDDEAPSDLDGIVERLRRRVDELDSPYLSDLRFMNGTPYLHLAGHPNHRGSEGEQILALFTEVGQIAPGSYGILYVADDEDPGHENEFRVFRMARGQVSEHPDPFLSPRAPTVEDG
jgi:Immunity protein 7